MAFGTKSGQSKGEEIANSISHAIGLIAAIVGTPLLIIRAVELQNSRFIVGVSIFCATIIFLYLASTVYHALPMGKAKRVFRVIEHSAIFLLIAGTYTPFTLGILSGVWGWTLFGIIWGLALVGVAMKTVYKTSLQTFFTCLYLLMGWVIVIAAEPLINRLPTAGVILLLAGGLSYTTGVIFFVLDSLLKYGHFIWHLFVMAGTALHYFSVFWYAA